MADEMKLKQAQAVFETMCKTLDKHEWDYDKDEEKLSIECSAQGEDLPIGITINIDADRMLIILLSHIPLLVSEEKRLELAAAVSIVNYILVDGNFDYNIETGRIVFRMTSSFMESLVGSEVFTYMLICSCQTVDLYNDKFMMLAKGLMSFDQFIKAIKNQKEDE